MREALLDKWNGLSGRERLFCAATLYLFLMYAAYAVVWERVMLDVANKKARLARLDSEYRNLQNGSRDLAELKEKLAMLKLELQKKMNEKRELHEGSEPLPPAETLLRELRRTAVSMPLQLVEMNVINGVPPAAGGISSLPERSAYPVSKISLSFRSNYRDAVSYCLKVIDLPYAISVKAVEMTRGIKEAELTGKHSGTRVPKGETLVNTRLELDIY